MCFLFHLGNGKVEYDEFEDMMASQMGEPITTDDLKYYFKKFDQNGDGSITSDELALVMKTFGGKTYSKEEIDAMIAKVDINSDGKVDYQGNECNPLSNLLCSRTGFKSNEMFRFRCQASPCLDQRLAFINLYLYSFLLKNEITPKKILKVIIRVPATWNKHRG